MVNQINNSQLLSSSQIFFSAGEPSGDAHAASLIREILASDSSMQCVGYGGPLMQKAGQVQQYDLTQKAVMFFKSVFGQLFFFRDLYKKTKKYFAEHQKNIKAVVLVDYPGFNWWVAKAAKSYGIPVYYFMPPQLWAWAGWRIKKMHKFVDYVFTTMPFETKWFQDNGCQVIEIGHPFLEEAKHHAIDAEFVKCLKNDASPILTILPGSRDMEIKNNFQDLLKIVENVQSVNPAVRPMIAAFNASHAEQIKQILLQHKIEIPVYVGKTQELIRAAHFALAVSGSVTMELLANHIPSVIYYRIGRAAHFVQRFFRRSRYITLVNLLRLEFFTSESPYFPEEQWMIPAYPSENDFNNMIFPEFLTPCDASEEAAECLLDFLVPQHYADCKKQLEELHEHLNPSQSPFQIAAQTLLKTLSIDAADDDSFEEIERDENDENIENIDENFESIDEYESDEETESEEDNEYQNDEINDENNRNNNENNEKEYEAEPAAAYEKHNEAPQKEKPPITKSRVEEKPIPIPATLKPQSNPKPPTNSSLGKKKKELSEDEILFEDASSSLLKKLLEE